MDDFTCTTSDVCMDSNWAVYFKEWAWFYIEYLSWLPNNHWVCHELRKKNSNLTSFSESNSVFSVTSYATSYVTSNA